MRRHIFPIHRGHLSDPFNFLRQEIDQIFENNTTIQGIRPDIEIKENKEGLQVRAELPGIDEKDIDITLSKGVLTLRGEKKSEETKAGETYHISELNYGSFTRSMTLPFEPDENDIRASFKNGVLQIEIPHPQVKKTNSHKIPIQSK